MKNYVHLHTKKCKAHKHNIFQVNNKIIFFLISFKIHDVLKVCMKSEKKEKKRNENCKCKHCRNTRFSLFDIENNIGNLG